MSRFAVRSSRSGQSNAGLVIGLVVVVLLLIGAGVMWSGVLNNKPNDGKPVAQDQQKAQQGKQQSTEEKAAAGGGARLDLAWLPPDAEMIVHVQPAKLFESELGKEYRDPEAIPPEMAKVSEEIGVYPWEIESATLSIPKLSERVEQGGPLALAQPPDEGILVVRLLKPLDPAKITVMGVIPTEAEHGGKKYQRFDGGPGGQPLGVYGASPTLLVVGDEPALQKALDRGEKATARPELDFIDTNQHLVVAFFPKNAQVLQGSAQFASQMAGAPIPAPLENDNLKAFAIGATLKQGLDLQIAMVGKDENATKEIQTAFEELVATGKESFAQLKDMLPPNLFDKANQCVQGIKVTGAGTVTRLTASLPELKDSDIMQLVFMGAMSGGAMSGGAMSGGGGAMMTLDAPKSPSIPATNADDLPAGLELTAHSEWNRFAEPHETSLRLMIQMFGPVSDRIAMAGNLKLDALETEPQVALKRRRMQNPGDLELVTRVDLLNRPVPPELQLSFDRTEPLPTAFTKVSGSFEIRVADELEPVELKNVRALAQKQSPAEPAPPAEPTPPDEKASDEEEVEADKPADEKASEDQPAEATSEAQKAGVRLQLRKIGEQETLVVSPEDGNVIRSVEALDGSGEPMDGAEVSGQGDYYVQVGEKPLPDDMTLRITFYRNLKTVEVPFVFENVPVIAPPELQPGYPPRTWQAADDADKLPKDLTLEAQARWKRLVGGHPGLEVALDLTGPLVQRIVQVGNLTIDAEAEGGDKLSPAENDDESSDVTKRLLRGKQASIRFDPAVDGLQIGIMYKAPETAPKKLGSVSGTFQIVVAGEQKTVKLEKVSEQEGEIENEALKQAEIGLKLTGGGIARELELTQGKTTAIASVRVLDADGHVVPKVDVSVDDDRNAITIYFSTVPPKDFGLEITLNLGVETTEVPFKFTDLPVPPELEKFE